MKKNLAALILAAAGLAGCSTPSHLVFHQSAVIGADISANTTSGQLNVSMGYDRQTSAIVPKTQANAIEPPGVTTEKNEAMSAISASKVTIKGIGEYEVNEQFATGQAATNLAKDPNQVIEISTLRENEEGNQTQGP